MGDTVRTVMGIKGEPATPDDPSQGLVWRAIIEQVDRAGSESAYVSVTDTPRATFATHPWSIGGGGAAELKELIESDCDKLTAKINSIGFAAITGEGDAFVLPPSSIRRLAARARAFGVGDEVRDWGHSATKFVVFPYSREHDDLKADNPREHLALMRYLWTIRTKLRYRLMFCKTPETAGLAWWELSFISKDRLQSQYLITFAFVATHNHFVLDRGGKVFNRSAPVIKLPANATEDAHLGLLGLLNSSVACFWLKPVAHNKGSTVDDRGARQRTAPFEDFYEFTGTQRLQFPLADPQPLDLARKLDTLARELSACLPSALVKPSPEKFLSSPWQGEGEGGGRTPDPGAASPSTTDAPRVPERGQTGVKK